MKAQKWIRRTALLFLQPRRQMGWCSQRQAPAALPLEKRSVTHCTRGCESPRASLDGCGISPPTGTISPERSACSQSLYRLSYPGPYTTSDVNIFFIHSIEAYRRRLTATPFLTSAPDGGHWLIWNSGSFITGGKKNPAATEREAEWFTEPAFMVWRTEKNLLPLPGFDFRTVQSLVLKNECDGSFDSVATVVFWGYHCRLLWLSLSSKTWHRSVWYKLI